MKIRIKTIKLTVTLSAILLANCAQAELSMNGQTTAQIGWGDNFEQARSIMYDEVAQPDTYVPKVVYTENVSSDIRYQNSSEQNSAYNQVDQKIIYNDLSNDISSYNSNSNENSAENYTSYQQYEGGAYASTNDYGKLYLNTNSRAVIVYDVISGKPIYEKNSSKARPIASISKLMTALVTLEAGLNMNDEIQIASSDFAGNGHTKRSSSRMKTGDRLNRSEMLLMTLMKSENPAAKSLARTYPGGYNAFMRAMNQKAQELGMYSTYFGDPTGLDTRNKASPNDLVKLIKEVGKYDIIRKYSTTAYHNFYIQNYSKGSRTYKGKNTSSFVRSKNHPINISKTGFINEAGKCMVMETNINNRPAIVVVLGASSYPKRNSDVKKILSSLEQRW